MASEPAEAASSRGALGRSIRSRQRPITLGRRAARASRMSIGQLGVRTRTFGMLAGLSFLDRVQVQRQLSPQAAYLTSISRPAAELFGGGYAAAVPDRPAAAAASLQRAEPLSPTMATTGSRKYDDLIRSMRAARGDDAGSAPSDAAPSPRDSSPVTAARQRHVQRAVAGRRRLPSTVNRRGATRAGRATSPGAGGRRFVPQPAAPAPTEATRHLYLPSRTGDGDTIAQRSIGPGASIDPSSPGASASYGPNLVQRQRPTTTSSSGVASDAWGSPADLGGGASPGPRFGAVAAGGAVALLDRPTVGRGPVSPLRFVTKSPAPRRLRRSVLSSPARTAAIDGAPTDEGGASLARRPGARWPDRNAGEGPTVVPPVPAGNRRLFRSFAARNHVHVPAVAAAGPAAAATRPTAEPSTIVGGRGLVRARTIATDASPAPAGDVPLRRAPVASLAMRPGFRPSIPLALRPPGDGTLGATTSDPRHQGELRRSLDGSSVSRARTNRADALVTDRRRDASVVALPPATGGVTRPPASRVDIAASVDATRQRGPGDTSRETRSASVGFTTSARPGRFFSRPIVPAPPGPSRGAGGPVRRVSSALANVLRRTSDGVPAPATGSFGRRPAPTLAGTQAEATSAVGESVVSGRPARDPAAESSTESTTSRTIDRPAGASPDHPASIRRRRLARIARPFASPSTFDGTAGDSSVDRSDRRQGLPVAPPRSADAAIAGSRFGSSSSPMSRPAVQRSTAASAAGPAGESLADRFLGELSRRRAETPRPLPMQLQPIARQIAGPRAVRIATGISSRRALAAVGKVAATTGDTVHLARTPDTSRRSVEVLAHELTHVAHSSPVPRFFDDDQHSVEERKAEVIGRIMADSVAPARPRSAVLPTSAGAAVRSRRLAPTGPVGTAHLPVGSPMQMLNASSSADAPSTIRRTAAARTATASSRSPSDPRGSVSAEEMIQRLRSGDAGPVSGPPSTGTVQREPAASSTIEAPPMSSVHDEPSGNDDSAVLGRLFDDASSADYHYFVDAVVEALEQRIIEELDRRGGRYRGGF